MSLLPNGYSTRDCPWWASPTYPLSDKSATISEGAAPIGGIEIRTRLQYAEVITYQGVSCSTLGSDELGRLCNSAGIVGIMPGIGVEEGAILASSSRISAFPRRLREIAPRGKQVACCGRSAGRVTFPGSTAFSASLETGFGMASIFDMAKMRLCFSNRTMEHRIDPICRNPGKGHQAQEPNQLAPLRQSTQWGLPR